MLKALKSFLRRRWALTPWAQSRYRAQALAYASGFFENGRQADIVISPRFHDALAELPVNERCYEYAFTIEKLREHGFTGKSLFDVGSATSPLPGVVAALGNRVVCVDIRRWPMVWPGLTTVEGSIFDAKLPEGSFDGATCISTIEHVGLGRFGDQPDPEGDLACMRRIRELLRPGGLVVLSMPYGRPTVVFPAHRVYSSFRVQSLAEGFEILEKRYYAPLEKPRSWVPCTEEDTHRVDLRISHATICCLLRKL